MLCRCVIVTCVLVLGYVGASKAEQPGSPDTAYVDGLPCNRLCLSYIAWSRRVLPYGETYSTAEPRSPLPLVHRDKPMRDERSKPARAGVAEAKQLAAPSKQGRHAKVAGLQPAAKAAVAQVRAAKPAARPSNDAPPAKVAGLAPAGDAPAAVEAPAPRSNEMPPAKVADLPPTASAAAGSEKPPTGAADPHPDAKAVEQQVTAATAVASQITAATAVPTPEQKAGQADGTDRRDTAMPADARKTATANGLVVLVMVGPDIKSVSDLSGQTIAVDDSRSAAGRQVRTAMIEAGATGIQVTDGPTKAIDRLISGTVPAAVLALVSAKAAEGFPEIAGFKVLQVPLSPSALKAGADTP